MTIQGFLGKSRVMKMGIWRFCLEDEEGKMHDIEIPMLSPQHWSQQNQNKRGTSCLIQHDLMILTWEGGRYSKHVMLNKEKIIADSLNV